MMNLTIDDEERTILLNAMSMYNDMCNDMFADEIKTINLHPNDGETAVLTAEDIRRFRKELNDAIGKQMKIVSLLTKLGGGINGNGYSV